MFNFTFHLSWHSINDFYQTLKLFLNQGENETLSLFKENITFIGILNTHLFHLKSAKLRKNFLEEILSNRKNNNLQFEETISIDYLIFKLLQLQHPLLIKIHKFLPRYTPLDDFFQYLLLAKYREIAKRTEKTNEVIFLELKKRNRLFIPFCFVSLMLLFNVSKTKLPIDNSD
jgi:hypothetical protein